MLNRVNLLVFPLKFFIKFLYSTLPSLGNSTKLVTICSCELGKEDFYNIIDKVHGHMQEFLRFSARWQSLQFAIF